MVREGEGGCVVGRGGRRMIGGIRVGLGIGVRELSGREGVSFEGEGSVVVVGLVSVCFFLVRSCVSSV